MRATFIKVISKPREGGCSMKVTSRRKVKLLSKVEWEIGCTISSLLDQENSRLSGKARCQTISPLSLPEAAVLLLRAATVEHS